MSETTRNRKFEPGFVRCERCRTASWGTMYYTEGNIHHAVTVCHDQADRRRGDARIVTLAEFLDSVSDCRIFLESITERLQRYEKEDRKLGFTRSHWLLTSAEQDDFARHHGFQAGGQMATYNDTPVIAL